MMSYRVQGEAGGPRPPLRDDAYPSLIDLPGSRVVVSPRGDAFVWQAPRPNGMFREKRRAVGRDGICEKMVLDGVSAETVERVRQALPKWPSEVVRPWADLEAERADREFADWLAADACEGVVCVDRSARVVETTSEDGHKVLFVQTRRAAGGWGTRAVCGSRDQLLCAVLSPGAHALGNRVVRSRALRDWADALPEW